jgi:hypothetical protein
MPEWSIDFVLKCISKGMTYRQIAPLINRHYTAVFLTTRNIAPERHRRALRSGYKARLYAGIKKAFECSSGNPDASGASSKGKPLYAARLAVARERHRARTLLPWLDTTEIDAKAKEALYSMAYAQGAPNTGRLPKPRKSRVATQQSSQTVYSEPSPVSAHLQAKDKA